MFQTLAILLGPLVCGAGYFLWVAQPQASGAYFETAGRTYRLPTCVPGTSTAIDPDASAPAAPDEITYFFLLGADQRQFPAVADAAKLFLRVVDRSRPDVVYERTVHPVTARRMNAQVIRFAPEPALRWHVNPLMNSVYERALTSHPGNRSTTELLLELETLSLPTQTCRSWVSLGAPPGSPNPAAWFVPPAEGHK